MSIFRLLNDLSASILVPPKPTLPSETLQSHRASALGRALPSTPAAPGQSRDQGHGPPSLHNHTGSYSSLLRGSECDVSLLWVSAQAVTLWTLPSLPDLLCLVSETLSARPSFTASCTPAAPKYLERKSLCLSTVISSYFLRNQCFPRSHACFKGWDL